MEYRDLKERVTTWGHKSAEWLKKLVDKLITLLIFTQIIAVLKQNHESLGGEPMSEPYNSFVNFCSFVNLDFAQLLPIDCLSTDHFDHLDKLVTVTILGPIIVSVWESRGTAAEARGAGQRCGTPSPPKIMQRLFSVMIYNFGRLHAC